MHVVLQLCCLEALVALPTFQRDNILQRCHNYFLRRVTLTLPTVRHVNNVRNP
jgi:acyl-CoA thioesterase